MIEHSWRECRPAVLALGGGESSDAAVAVDMVWATLTDHDRQCFHRACCFDSRAADDLATIERIIGAIRTRMAELG